MRVTETNMTKLRSNLNCALDKVSSGDIVLIKRRGKSDVAMVDSDLLEDYIAAINPRIIEKTALARSEVTSGNTIPYVRVVP